MSAIDLDEMERLAKAAQHASAYTWYSAEVLEEDDFLEEHAKHISACSPDRILALVEEVRRLQGARDDLLSEVRDLERELREAYSDPRLQFP